MWRRGCRRGKRWGCPAGPRPWAEPPTARANPQGRDPRGGGGGARGFRGLHGGKGHRVLRRGRCQRGGVWGGERGRVAGGGGGRGGGGGGGGLGSRRGGGGG